MTQASQTAKPRVCHLSSVHRALDGRIFYREAHTLARAGYDVCVIALHPCDEVVDGIQVLGLPAQPKRFRPMLWRRLYVRAVATQAALYHIHDPELLPLALLLRMRTGRPVIYDVHEANPEFIAMKAAGAGAGRDLARQSIAWLEPQLARPCAAVITADAKISEGFAGLDKPQAVLYNYPTARFIARAVPPAAADRPPTIIHLGIHTIERGALLMVDAFALVHAACPEARLLMVGHFHPSELENVVRSRSAAAGVSDAVTLAGRAPFADVGRYLQEAAIGWIPLRDTPKYQKNVPTKLFEYMAYGLPVVSSKLDSVGAYVGGGGAGLLAEAVQPAAHAAALLALLRNPQAARAMGHTGRSLVETRYNWSAMETRLVGLYESVLVHQ